MSNASSAPVVAKTELFAPNSFEGVLTEEYHRRRTFSSFKNSTLEPENTPAVLLCCNYLPLIHPYGPFRYFMDFFITICLIYTCVEVPVTLAFGVDFQFTTLRFIDLSIDILLLFDVIINFRQAYFDKFDRLTLIRDPQMIAKHYFTSWFFIDFIASLPFQHLHNDSYVVFGLLRCLKILRLIKILRIYNKFKKTILSRNIKTFIKLFKLLLSMLLFAHFSACFWYFIGYHNTGANGTDETWIDSQGLRDSGLSTFTLYSYAWYWAVVTLFTTGYGDITATNTLEQWVCSILILIGTCFFSYFIGTLTVLITEGDKEASYRLDRLEEAQIFCIQKKLPPELTRAILTHTRYYCANNYVFDEDTAVNILPLHLQLQIEYYLSSHFIKQIRIFKSLNDSVLGQIALKIRSISCNATHTLYHKGQRAKEIYIQRTGLSELNYYDARKEKQPLSRGEVFGEDAFISPKRKTTATCKTWCEFYVIAVADIINILQSEYPKTYLKKLRIIIQNIRSKTQHQQKIDFSKQSENHRSSYFELERFLNQPVTDLGVRMSPAPMKKPPIIKKTRKSKLQFSRNSSQNRDLMARRQLTKRTLHKAREQQKAEEELNVRQKKANQERLEFYANNESLHEMDTDEDIGDIVPGLCLTNDDTGTHMPPMQFVAKKKQQYGGSAAARKFGMKGVRRKKIKRNANKNTKANTSVVREPSSAYDAYEKKDTEEQIMEEDKKEIHLKNSLGDRKLDKVDHQRVLVPHYISENIEQRKAVHLLTDLHKLKGQIIHNQDVKY